MNRSDDCEAPPPKNSPTKWGKRINDSQAWHRVGGEDRAQFPLCDPSARIDRDTVQERPNRVNDFVCPTCEAKAWVAEFYKPGWRYRQRVNGVTAPDTFEVCRDLIERIREQSPHETNVEYIIRNVDTGEESEL